MISACINVQHVGGVEACHPHPHLQVRFRLLRKFYGQNVPTYIGLMYGPQQDPDLFSRPHRDMSHKEFCLAIYYCPDSFHSAVLIASVIGTQ